MAIHIQTRLRKGILITVASVSILIIFILLFINSLLAPIISQKIRNGVIKASDSLYHVNFSHIKLHILSGNAELEDITLIPDTMVFHRRMLQGKGPGTLFNASAKQLLITGARPFSFWFSKKLIVGQVSLVDPKVSASVYAKTATKTPEKKDSTLYQKISSSLKLIRVNLISLKHVHLKYNDLTGRKPSIYELKDMNMQATGLLIDSTTQKDTIRTLFCEDITTNASNLNGLLSDGTYHYRLVSATFSTNTARLKLSGIELQPLSPDAFFAKTNEDRFALKLDSVVLAHFNFKTFQINHYIDAKKVTISKGSFSVYSNPHGPLAKTDRIITYPNYVVRKLNIGLNVDTLDIRQMNISYTERNKTAGKTGSVQFSQTSARFLNITNQKNKINRNELCRIKLSTLFMGRAKLDLSVVFNLRDTNYAYSYQGHLATMPLDAVNTSIMPLALVRINSGRLTSLDFDIKGDKKKSTGTINVLYHDLDIHLLESGPQESYHTKPLKTLLANTLIIKHDNPDNSSLQPRFAKVVYLRPKNHPFFESLWETLLSGIKTCAGIGYAVKDDQSKPLSKKEQKANDKALKKAEKDKKKADKKYRRQLQEQSVKSP